VLTVIDVPGAISDGGELLRALAFEARALGAEVRAAADDDFAGDESDSIRVFAPGDLYGVPGRQRPSERQVGRAIAVCEKAPTGPLDPAYLYARQAAAALTPDPSGATLLRRRGAEVAEVRLGHSDAWTVGQPEISQGAGGHPDTEAEREIDVACLSGRGVWADRLLASYGKTLWRRRCHLLGAAEVPTGADRQTIPPPTLGRERLRVLRAARVVLLGIGEEGASVERLRALQAVSCGAVVCAPHGLDLEPFRPGRDYAAGESRNLGLVADGLLREPQRMDALRASALATMREGPALLPAAEQLLELAERVHAKPARRRRTTMVARVQSSASAARDHVRESLRPPPNPRRVAGKRAALESIRARRSETAAARGEGSDEAVTLHTTPSYDGAQPQISVCVPVYEHADVLPRALQSACGTGRDDVELVICDDASGDDSVGIACAFLEERPWLPARLLGRSANLGLGPGRNDMAAASRGELLFMLDADNEIYPTALGRLSGALDADPDAAFAYPLIEAHTDGRPRGLLSSLPWDPLRLRRGNYIDAMSMIRRTALLGSGGYTEDIELHGWEDFDLWCRFAVRGLRGVMLPEILCRYSLSEASMISVTNLDSSEAWALLQKRYPEVLGGAPLPTYPDPPPDRPL